MDHREHHKETQTHRESLLFPRHIEDSLSSEDDYSKATQTHKESLMYSKPDEISRLLSPDLKYIRMDMGSSEHINSSNNKTHTEKRRVVGETITPTERKDFHNADKSPHHEVYDHFSLPDFKSKFLENDDPDRNDSPVKMTNVESKFPINSGYSISQYGRKMAPTYLGLTGYPEFDLGDNLSLLTPQSEPTSLQLEREEKYQQEMMNQVQKRTRQVEDNKYPPFQDEISNSHDFPQHHLRDKDKNNMHTARKNVNEKNKQNIQHRNTEGIHPQQETHHPQKRNWEEPRHSQQFNDDKNSQSRSSNGEIANRNFPHLNLETRLSSSSINQGVEKRQFPSPARAPHRITPLNYVELNKRDFRKVKPDSTYSEILKLKKERFEQENLNRSNVTKNRYDGVRKEFDKQLSVPPKRKSMNASGAKSHEDLWNQRSVALGATRDSKIDPSKQNTITSKETFGKYPLLGDVQTSRQSNKDKSEDHKVCIDINLNLGSQRDVDQNRSLRDVDQNSPKLNEMKSGGSGSRIQMKTQALPALGSGKECSRHNPNGFLYDATNNNGGISPMSSESTGSYPQLTHKEDQVNDDERDGLNSKMAVDNNQYSSSLPSHRRRMKVGRHGLYPVHDYHDYTQARQEAKLTSLVGTGDSETMSEKRERVAIHQQYGRLIRQKNKQDETKAKRAAAATGPRKAKWVL